jgi:hypothetical protein
MSCWRGIQPAISEEAFGRLAASIAGYADSRITLLGGPGQIYIFQLENPNLLTTRSDQVTVRVEFATDPIVRQVSFADIDICLSTVIDAYGIPDVVSEMTGAAGSLMFAPILLGYPEDGLLFGIRKDTARVASASIMAGSRVRSLLEAGQPLQWATILGTSLGCRDNFHP